MNKKHLQLHVTALQAIVMGMLVAMAKRDPAAALEIVNDPGVTDVASLPELQRFSERDRKDLQAILDNLLRPLRTAITPPEGSA